MSNSSTLYLFLPSNHNFNPLAYIKFYLVGLDRSNGVISVRNDLVYNCQPNHISHLNCSYAVVRISAQFVLHFQSICLLFSFSLSVSVSISLALCCLLTIFTSAFLHVRNRTFASKHFVWLCSEKWLQAKIVLPII